MRQISASVYQLTRYVFVNIYLIVNGDVLTVVDAGINKSDIDALIKAIEAQGWSTEQIQHILVTHAHYDHIGGLAYLQTLTNAQTYIHRLDAPIVRGEQAVTYANPNDLGFFSRLQSLILADNSNVEPVRIDTILHGDELLNDIYPAPVRA